MKIGFPNHPRREILAEIEWIGAHGFGFVDLFLEADQATVERIDPLRIREALDRLGLDAVGHLAWYLPIGSPLRPLRRAAVEIAREYLEVLARIGVPAATIHAHWPPGSLFSAAEGLAWQIESLRELLKIGQDLGVRIMYEPIDTAKDTPANLKTILTKLPDLLCHLDLGHCNLFGKKPEEMIRRFATRLHHVHLHDNTGGADLHLPPGAGTIAWPAVLRALKEVSYDRTITLEVFSPDRDYVLLAKQKIEALWNQVDTESELLLKINRGVPPGVQKRYEELIARRRAEALTSDEYQELLRLTNRVEKIEARRVEHLAELARLRQTSLPALMKELGIRNPAYV